jgi:hypothetical protein
VPLLTVGILVADVPVAAVSMALSVDLGEE